MLKAPVLALKFCVLLSSNVSATYSAKSAWVLLHKRLREQRSIELARVSFCHVVYRIPVLVKYERIFGVFCRIPLKFD